MPLITANVDLSSGDRSINFGLSLHPHPYILYASIEGSGYSAHNADSPEPWLLAAGISTEL